MLSTLRTVGILIALVGIWGAAIPYVGPLFGYPMPPGADVPAWEWTAGHWQLHLVPGLVAIAGGVMVATVRRAGFGSLLALASGAWFVVGNEFARLWLPVGGGGGANVAEWTMVATILGYHDGIGLVLIVLAAAAIATTAARSGARADVDRRREPLREPEAAGRRGIS